VPRAQTGLWESYGIVLRYINRVGLGERDVFACPLAEQRSAVWRGRGTCRVLVADVLPTEAAGWTIESRRWDMTDDRQLQSLGDGGDAACWLSQVCTECGALREAPLPAVCWRCGAEAISR
jgi:hypothetical protein